MGAIEFIVGAFVAVFLISALSVPFYGQHNSIEEDGREAEEALEHVLAGDKEEDEIEKAIARHPEAANEPSHS